MRYEYEPAMLVERESNCNVSKFFTLLMKKQTMNNDHHPLWLNTLN
jgi:hypothetical protein